MKNSDYITIQAPMVKDLDLRGNALIIFALIHGFTKDGEHEFNGSIDYMMKWTNLSKTCVMNTLKKLVEDGFLNKNESTINGVKFCSYTTNYEAMLAKCTSGTQNVPPVQNVVGGGTQCAPNIYNDIDSNNILIKKSPKFIPPTFEEVKDYITSRRSIVDPEAFFAYYESTGWMVGNKKMKNWRMAVVTWEKRRGSWSTPTAAPRARATSNFTSMKELGAKMFGVEEEVADEQ